jgi:hypothetical protein
MARLPAVKLVVVRRCTSEPRLLGAAPPWGAFGGFARPRRPAFSHGPLDQFARDTAVPIAIESRPNPTSPAFNAKIRPSCRPKRTALCRARCRAPHGSWSDSARSRRCRRARCLPNRSLRIDPLSRPSGRGARPTLVKETRPAMVPGHSTAGDDQSAAAVTPR